MHNRHLRRLVACHACGRTTHPLAKRLAAASEPKSAAAKPPSTARDCTNCGHTIGKLQTPKDWRGQTVCHACHSKLALESEPPEPARASAALPARGRNAHKPCRNATSPAPTGLELSIGPLAPMLLVGMTGAAFFVAISVMSYVGGFLSALLLVAAAAVGLRWLKRGTLSFRARLDQIEGIRLRHGIVRVVAMLLAWLWSQPPRRKPWACLLMAFWGVLYVPYCVSGMLLPVPRTRIMRAA
jgi:hypothetical protein